jgi:predicted XRE-type DNA-binding protein
VGNDTSAIAAILDRLARGNCTEVARIIGRDHATISKAREKFRQWKAHELLQLAVEYPDLAQAIRDYLAGLVPKVGTPKQVFADTMEEMCLMGKLSETISARLQDGNVSQKDAADILDQVRPLMTYLAKTVIPELEAVKKGKGQ